MTAASRSLWAQGAVLDESMQPFHRLVNSRQLLMQHSLGWMELRTTLAKLLYTYDLELLDSQLDWHKDSKMHTLWQKPSLRIKLHLRAS